MSFKRILQDRSTSGSATLQEQLVTTKCQHDPKKNVYEWICDICHARFVCLYCKKKIEKKEKNDSELLGALKTDLSYCELVNMKFTDYDSTVKHICQNCYSGTTHSEKVVPFGEP